MEPEFQESSGVGDFGKEEPREVAALKCCESSPEVKTGEDLVPGSPQRNRDTEVISLSSVRGFRRSGSVQRRPEGKYHPTTLPASVPGPGPPTTTRM